MNKGTYIYRDIPVDEVFLSASEILYEAVGHTIGPKGLNSAIPTGNGYLSIINDGKTILESLSSDNPAIKLALNTLKESSFATNQNAGDGTTSTIILQHVLLRNVLIHNEPLKSDEELPEEFSPITSKDLIDIRDKFLAELPNFRREIKTEEDLLNVIKVSLGSEELAPIVLEAFKGLNKDQRPSLIKTTTTDKTEVISIDGVSLAPVEVNPVVLRSMPSSVEEPLNVVVLKQQVSRIDKAFASLLQKMANSPKKTILLYTEIMPSVLDQILFNIQEGTLNVIPVRLACSIDKVDDIVEELSKYFNLAPMDDLNPYQTAFTNSNIFGQATGYILNKDSIIIKNDNEEYSSSLLPSKSTAIQVGFVTYSKQDEIFRRLEDAIHSAYNALNYGYTYGAGFTYKALGDLLPDEPKYNALKESLGFMFYTLAQDYTLASEFITYIENNIYDSYKVTEQVILNAFTVVSQVLSTKCIIVPYK